MLRDIVPVVERRPSLARWESSRPVTCPPRSVAPQRRGVGEGGVSPTPRHLVRLAAVLGGVAVEVGLSNPKVTTELASLAEARLP